MVTRKNLIPLILFFSLIATGFAQEGPIFSFEKEKHDYGEIPFDSMPDDYKYDLDIKYINTGDSALVLDKINVCCGSLLNHYTEEPVMPGDTGTINITLRLHPRTEKFLRAITVYSNSSDRPAKVFHIVGEVVRK
ncbi:MAG: DUF1573 domain-containing protein [Bacteroidales bacterium]